ncbi:MAG: ComF family protein [Gemmatimonadetes bacterium]|nr:ComF family protein [Gemmatimonadota bacterium]
MNWLRELCNGALDLVFAPVCVACKRPVSPDEPERLICRVCWTRTRPIPAPRCSRCSAPVPPDREPDPRCTACRDFPPALRVVRSACVMEEPVREMIHALKYAGWTAVAGPLARRMAALPLPADVSEEARRVVAVPTSRLRLRERGYNQAALLAEAFAARTGRDFTPDVLLRTRATETQTTLHPDERRANVAGAFAPAAGVSLAGEHVLLVDDVWTTGATALACADALFSARARAVSVLTFARALPGLDRPSP